MLRWSGNETGDPPSWSLVACGLVLSLVCSAWHGRDLFGSPARQESGCSQDCKKDNGLVVR